MTEKQRRQNTGNHPDPLAEAFLITAAQLEELTTHAAVASSAACHGSTTREKAAWKLFDAVVENVKAQRASEPDLLESLKLAEKWAGEFNCPPHVWPTIRAAIAKAEEAV